jgi:hypothetical protein
VHVGKPGCMLIPALAENFSPFSWKIPWIYRNFAENFRKNRLRTSFSQDSNLYNHEKFIFSISPDKGKVVIRPGIKIKGERTFISVVNTIFTIKIEGFLCR